MGGWEGAFSPESSPGRVFSSSLSTWQQWYICLAVCTQVPQRKETHNTMVSEIVVLFHLKAEADMGGLLHQPRRDEDPAPAVQDAHRRVLSSGCPAPLNLLHPPLAIGVVFHKMEQAGPRKHLQVSAFGNYRARSSASSYPTKL